MAETRERESDRERKKLTGIRLASDRPPPRCTSRRKDARRNKARTAVQNLPKILLSEPSQSEDYQSKMSVEIIFFPYLFGVLSVRLDQGGVLARRAATPLERFPRDGRIERARARRRQVDREARFRHFRSVRNPVAVSRRECFRSHLEKDTRGRCVRAINERIVMREEGK